MARGVRRSPLYPDDDARRYFLGVLSRAGARVAWELLAFCLVGNHYHLVVRTPVGGRPRGMQLLNSAFAMWFNEVYGYTGHVFESPYRCVLVTKPEQLLTTIRYVLLNAVEAGLCAHPAAWPWCSYAATVGDAAAPKLLSRRALLGLIHADDQRAADIVRRFVLDGLDDARRLAEPDTSRL
jgi:hypothetical protein